MARDSQSEMADLKSFEEAFQHLVFRFEAPENARQMVGVAIAPAAHSNTGAAKSKSKMPPSVDDSDKAAIQQLVADWEKLDPADFPKKWKHFATNPFCAVGPGWVKVVNQEFLDGWVKSRAFKSLMKAFQPHSPRKSKVSRVKVTWVGTHMANVTYHVQETTQTGKSAGNAAMIVMKLAKGWRIGAVCRFDEFGADEAG